MAIRLPDGRRIQRNFLHTDSIKVTSLKSNFLLISVFLLIYLMLSPCSSCGHSALLKWRMGIRGLSTLYSPFLEHPRTWSMEVIKLSKKPGWPTRWSTFCGTKPISISSYAWKQSYSSMGFKMILLFYFCYEDYLIAPLLSLSPLVLGVGAMDKNLWPELKCENAISPLGPTCL